MNSLNTLNSEQLRAATTKDGPLLILAGAGSGKTKTIVHRISYLVLKERVPTHKILGVSFTNKAANELRERVKAQLGRSTDQLTLCTFHSLGIIILKNEIHKLGYNKSFSIFDQNDQLSLVKEKLRTLRDDKKFDSKAILSKIGFLKNKGISPDGFSNSKYFDHENPYDLATEFVYHQYQDSLKFFNAIDFDDILYLTVELFKLHPETAKLYSQKWKYIMVDEYQDTNPLQFQLIKSLTITHQNLCVVGDDDQSIYSFRGADISNILEFERIFPECVTIRLERNYRSTNTILNLANEVIKANPKRKGKNLYTDKRSPHTPILWAMADPTHEAQVLVEEIENYRKSRHSLSDVAILFRSKTQAPILEEELRFAGVPYRLLGGQKFFEKKEVKGLLAYLSVIHNPANETGLRRILNVPNRGIGLATLKKYLKKSEEIKRGYFLPWKNTLL